MPDVLLSPLVDFLFKRIFGDEQNTDILMAFLNGIFEDSSEPLVESVQILNPFIEKDALTDKMSILDIRARTQAQTIVNIEIQVRQTGEMRERSLYYWAKRYQSQLKAGDTYTYGRLHRVVVINVLNFVEIDHPGYHNVFHIRSQAGLRLTDHLAMHFFGVAQTARDQRAPKGPSGPMAVFLSAKTPETLADIVKGDAVMEKAMTTLEVLSQDDQTRLLYEARQMALHDYASAIATAKDEGREEGLHRKAVEVAHKLLLAKTPLSTVVEITRLSLEELHRVCPSVD